MSLVDALLLEAQRINLWLANRSDGTLGCFLDLGQLHPGTAASLTSLVRDSGDPSVALATTSMSAHGLQPGERVKINASSGSPSQFKGFFVIKGVPTANQFRYQMSSDPAANASTGVYQKVMGCGRLVFENNSIELAAGSEGDLGIHIHDAAQSGQAPDYTHGDVIIQNNKIGYVDLAYDSGYAGSAMELHGIKNLQVMDNVVDVFPSNPIKDQRSGSVACFNNNSPGGTLIQGYNEDMGKKHDELETEAEDALVLALFNR